MTTEDPNEDLVVRLVYNTISVQQWGEGGTLKEIEQRAKQSPAWTGEAERRYRALGNQGFSDYKRWREGQFSTYTPDSGIYNTDEWKSLSQGVLGAGSLENALEVARSFVKKSDTST